MKCDAFCITFIQYFFFNSDAFTETSVETSYRDAACSTDEFIDSGGMLKENVIVSFLKDKKKMNDMEKENEDLRRRNDSLQGQLNDLKSQIAVQQSGKLLIMIS